jgi:F-box-like
MQAHHGTKEERTKGGRSSYISCTVAYVPTVDWCDHNVARVGIDMLPHVALLNIFDLYLEEEYINPMDQIDKPQREVWRTLAHVCRKWRNIVFGSPHRLDLRVYCRASTRVREMLDIWPNLPIVVWVYDDLGDLDNTIAALEHTNRVCAIYLWYLQNYHSEDILAAMQQPFPALTHLVLGFTRHFIRIRSWVDPYNVYNYSCWTTPHFRD